MQILKKIIKTLVIVIVTVIVIDAVFVLAFPKHSLPSADAPADAIIVLGAAPNSPAIRNRATEGYELYTEGRARQIILTGGNTSSLDESEAMNMARFLTKNKTTTLPLILEEHSTDTFENLRNSKELVASAKSVIIVSDTYHLARAFLVAKRLGYEDVYWSAPDSGYYKPRERAWYYGREMVALIAYIPKLVHL